MRRKKKLHIIYDVNFDSVDKINKWIYGKNMKDPVVLVQEFSTLKNQNWRYPIYTEKDLIPTSSAEEEEIYKKVFLYMKDVFEFLKHDYKKINIFEDFFSTMCNLEVIVIIACSISKLLSKYESVIVCFDFTSYYYDSLALTLKNFFSNVEIFISKYNPTKKTIKVVEHDTCLESIEEVCRMLLSMLKNVHNKKNDKIYSPDLKLYADTPCLLFTSTINLFKNNFVPVYNFLKNKNNRPPLLIGSKYLTEVAKSKNMELIPLENYFESGNFWDILRKVFCLFTLVIKRNYFINKIKKFANTDIASVTLGNILISYFQHNFFSRMNVQIDLINSIGYILKKSKPSSVYKDVARTNYDAMIRGFCRQLKIPVVTSIFASITDSYRNFLVYPVDYITVLGKLQTQYLLNRGFREDQIIPVGQPEIDEVFDKWNNNSSKQYVKDAFRVNFAGKKLLLVATSGLSLLDEKKWINHLSDLVESSDKAFLIIKPHPVRREQYNYIQESKKVLVVAAETNLYPFVIASDFVFTDVSHAGKIAILFKKPLFVMNYTNVRFEYNNFDEEKVAKLISSNDELSQQFYYCLENQAFDFSNYEQYICNHMTAADGRASERISNLIMNGKFKKDIRILTQ